jgi:hypothetical protein
MKHSSSLLLLACITALAFSFPITASAQSTQSASPSPAATSSESSSAKPGRAIPLTGKVSEVDSSAKTFTIAGKKASRVFKITDRSTVTKEGAAATFEDITADGKVTGSYWKQEDGTLEIKTLKIGGGATAEKSTSKKSKKKAGSDDEEAGESGSASPSPSPKK